MGGGGVESTPSTFRAIISRTALSLLFSFESCATFDAIFVKIGHTVPKLRNVIVIERRLKIWEFSGFVYKTYGKWLFVLKIHFGSKSVLFALILVNITVICIDYQYLNNSK